MAVNTSFVGRVYRSEETYQVSREKIREFALATGSQHPAHLDPSVAGGLGHADVVAPPTFAVVIAQRAEAAYIEDPEAGVDFSRVVHADERFTHHRPLVAGDEVRATVHVDAVVARGALTMVTTRTEIADLAGAPVSTVVSTLAVRGQEA